MGELILNQEITLADVRILLNRIESLRFTGTESQAIKLAADARRVLSSTLSLSPRVREEIRAFSVSPKRYLPPRKIDTIKIPQGVNRDRINGVRPASSRLATKTSNEEYQELPISIKAKGQGAVSEKGSAGPYGSNLTHGGKGRATAKFHRNDPDKDINAPAPSPHFDRMKKSDSETVVPRDSGLDKKSKNKNSHGFNGKIYAKKPVEVPTPTPAVLAGTTKPTSLLEVSKAREGRTHGTSPEISRAEFQNFINFDAKYFEFVSSAVDNWMAKKGIDLKIESPQVVKSENWEAKVVTGEEGEFRFYQLILLETQDNGRSFRTAVVLSRGVNSAWLWIEVESPSKDAVGIPSLLRDLSSLEIRDGSWSINTGCVEVKDRIRAEFYLEYLLSGDREVPVFVYTIPVGEDSLGHYERIKSWSRDLSGLAPFLVLEGEAASIFDHTLSPYAPTRPGYLRTYHPKIDPGNPKEWQRHRYFNSQTLQDRSEHNIRSILSYSARSRWSGRPVPQEVYAAETALRRASERRQLANWRDGERIHLRSHLVSSSAHQTNLVPDEVDLVIALKELIHVKELDDDLIEEFVLWHEQKNSIHELGKILEGKNGEIDYLREEMREIDQRRYDLEQALSVSEESEQWYRIKVAHLQKSLMRIGGAREAWEEPDHDAPTSLSNLLDLLGEGRDPRVVFTGKVKPTEELEEVDTNNRAARGAWAAVLCLRDYARAKEEGSFSGSVHAYLADAPDGAYTVPTYRHAALESKSTMDAYGSERLFPVPSDVDESGFATMQAHFRISTDGGIKSGRMHYLDDTAKSGKIYIGYIGPHLRTVGTN